MTTIEPWIIALIRRRAKRLGLKGQDLEDAQQDVILDVLAFSFDAAKSNGATLSTALTALVDRRLLRILRDRRRYKKRLERLNETLDTRSEPAVLQVDHDLAFDLQAAVAQLPPREQAICEALSRGESLAEIVRRMECGWNTIYKSLERIRQHFVALDLDHRQP